jgi:hypothetical protein
MAKSIGRPVNQPGGRLNHRLSASRIVVLSGPDDMTHRLEHDGIAASYRIDYFVGSGHKGRSYLVGIAGRLFQSPASYYTDRGAWDLSPGFHQERELDFDRPITPECLFCHSGRARPIPYTLNGYESPPFEAEAITCDRCHGSPEVHLAKPSAANIVNPAKLAPRLRDAICEQCHLGGEARILNPGRQPWDFRPRAALEEVMSVYVFERPAASGVAGLKVVGHTELLAASRCAQASGTRMWCGTCHNPHVKPDDPKAYYRGRCRQCHTAASMAGHVQPADDCVGCHMPSRQAYDGGHTAFTDHQILARTRGGPGTPEPARKLAPWRDPVPSLARRNLGLAYISVGERDQSSELLNEGFRHLSAVASDFAGDAAVLTSLGAVLQRKGVPREAARYFRRAAELEPRDARHRLNLAVALSSAAETGHAIRVLQGVISEDPSLVDAYLLLAEIYRDTGNEEQRRATLRRYLLFAPQSIAVRKLLRPSR